MYLDEKIRDRAVRTVQTFLSSRCDSLNYDEYLKLWKGFFYCFWLSDKTEGQFNLGALIAKLVHNLPAEKKGTFSDSGAALFLRSFWETMGREWPRLDRLRLNKYYNLMKQVLFESFQMITVNSSSEESACWTSDLIKGHTAILLGTVFDYSNRAFPESIRIYVIENYFDSLKAAAVEPFSAETTVLVCEPILHAVAYCQSKVFFKQASEALIQGILPGEDESEDMESSEEEGIDRVEEEEEEKEDVEMSQEEEKEEAESSEEDLEEDLEEVDSEVEEVECDESGESVVDDDEEQEADFNSEDFDNIKDDVGSDCDSNEEELECDEEELEEDLEEDLEEEDVDSEECEGEDCCESGQCCNEDNEDCCDEECSDEDCEEEESVEIFDYSQLGKFIFDLGARSDVLIRNRRFLYEFSSILDEINQGYEEATATGTGCCDHDHHHERSHNHHH